MKPRRQRAFLALILAQAAHSAEEIAFRLHDVFLPSRYIAGLLSSDPTRGFLLGNLLIVGFGLWCYVALVRRDRPSAEGVMWFWVVLEALNGVGHVAIALSRGEYFPGAGTAPLLLVLAVYLGRQLWQEHDLPVPPDA